MRFLERYGCAADARRRSDVTNSLGVTRDDLRKHHFSVISGLQESGLSRATVHELMLPPRQKKRTSKWYRGLVRAREGAKCNDLPQNTLEDSHICSSEVKLATKFGAKHDDKVATLSVDDMNKLYIEVPAVNRYHQLRHFFISGDGPIFPGRDFPCSDNRQQDCTIRLLTTRRTALRRSSGADHRCADSHHHRVQQVGEEVAENSRVCTLRRRQLSPISASRVTEYYSQGLSA